MLQGRQSGQRIFFHRNATTAVDKSPDYRHDAVDAERLARVQWCGASNPSEIGTEPLARRSSETTRFKVRGAARPIVVGSPRKYKTPRGNTLGTFL